MQEAALLIEYLHHLLILLYFGHQTTWYLQEQTILLFDLYIVFIFVLYYTYLFNTIAFLSIFNYLRKFDGRVLYPHSLSYGFYDMFG